MAPGDGSIGKRACTIADLRLLWSSALARRDRAGALQRLRERIRETIDELRQLHGATSSDTERATLDAQLREVAEIERRVHATHAALPAA